MANTNTNTPKPATPSTSNPTPLPQVNFTESDLSNPTQFIAMLNSMFNNIHQVMNTQQGFGGPIPINNHLDMQGNQVINIGQSTAPNSAISKSVADANYSAPVLQSKLSAGGSSSMLGYRQINNVSQREQNSSYMNDLVSTAPTANSATISATAPVGGHTSVTVSAGTLYFVDGTIINFHSLTSSLAVPSSGESYFYVYVQKRSAELFLNPTAYSVDSWANRINSSFDGSTLIAVIALNSSGLDSTNSAAGGTAPAVGAGVRLFGRL